MTGQASCPFGDAGERRTQKEGCLGRQEGRGMQKGVC